MLVEIFSDVVCPWCAIGKARFEQALGAFEDAERVEVVWRSFELDPNAPRERSGDLASDLAAKYGTNRDEALAMMDRVRGIAAEEGLDFRFDIAQPGNTFDAHRLLHLAKARGLQRQLASRLFRAYFSEGRAIADPAELQRLAVKAGLDEVEAKQVLASDQHADDVRADEALAATYGVRGVPFFAIDQRYGISGAQPTAVLLDALRQHRG